MIGYLSSTDVESLGFTNLVSGVTWLVRNSSLYLNQSIAYENPSFDFVNEKAPRSAIGHDIHGNLLLFEVCPPFPHDIQQHTHAKKKKQKRLMEMSLSTMDSTSMNGPI